MFIHILFHVCICVIVLSLRSDSDYNKEATYLLTYLPHWLSTDPKIDRGDSMIGQWARAPDSLVASQIQKLAGKIFKRFKMSVFFHFNANFHFVI